MKYSRTESVYTRITFKMDDGSWAKTDIVDGYRNSVRWRPIIAAGVGTVVKNLLFKRKGEINADSYPVITIAPEKPVEEELKITPNVQEKLI